MPAQQHSAFAPVPLSLTGRDSSTFTSVPSFRSRFGVSGPVACPPSHHKSLLSPAFFFIRAQQPPPSPSESSASTTARRAVIPKPLGVTLEELSDGSCFVAAIDPQGNTAKNRTIALGDIIVKVGPPGLKQNDESVPLMIGKGLDFIQNQIKDVQEANVAVIVDRPGNLGLDDVVRLARRARDGVDPEVKKKLRKEAAAPYTQNWLGIVVVIVFVLVILTWLTTS